MNSRFYTDLQLRFYAGDDQQYGFALGVNNLFGIRTPGCVTCDINNLDPTVHDVPGRYFYARASVRM